MLVNTLQSAAQGSTPASNQSYLSQPSIDGPLVSPWNNLDEKSKLAEGMHVIGSGSKLEAPSEDPQLARTHFAIDWHAILKNRLPLLEPLALPGELQKL